LVDPDWCGEGVLMPPGTPPAGRYTLPQYSNRLQPYYAALAISPLAS
jgi:hypothetical protein